MSQVGQKRIKIGKTIHICCVELQKTFEVLKKNEPAAPVESGTPMLALESSESKS